VRNSIETRYTGTYAKVKPQRRKARVFLKGIAVTSRERVYFREFLEKYREFKVLAYDLMEILCEKVRAILTKRVRKLRDFYDLYMLDRARLRVEDYKKEIALKLRPVLRYLLYLSTLKTGTPRAFRTSASLLLSYGYPWYSRHF